jgi:hypothetical protein
MLIFFNPSKSSPANVFDGTGQAITAAALLFVLSFITYAALCAFTRTGFFYGAFILLLLLHICIGSFLFAGLHRDYFTVLFQTIIAFFIVYVHRISYGVGSLKSRFAVEGIYRVTLLIVFCLSLWTIAMGYAVATRQEPRWIESIFYNIYNILLIFALYSAASGIRLRGMRRIAIGPASLKIDDYDFTHYLGQVNLDMINHFLNSKDNGVLCSELAVYLLNHHKGSASKWDCRLCVEQKQKVTLCPKYKSVYNRILEIKKLFETMEIGTIVSPQNKLNILAEGWRLFFFSSVRLILKKEGSDGLSNAIQRLKISP